MAFVCFSATTASVVFIVLLARVRKGLSSILCNGVAKITFLLAVNAGFGFCSINIAPPYFSFLVLCLRIKRKNTPAAKILNAIITPKAVAAAAAGAICTFCVFICGGKKICVIFVDEAVCDIVDDADFVGERDGVTDGASVFDGLTLFDCVGLPVLLTELVGDGD